MIGIDLDGRIAVVTGCASPFGQAIATLLTVAGARVHGADIVLDSCGELEARGIALARIDLTNPAETADWIRAIERNERRPITFVIHNAGGVSGQGNTPFEEVSDAAWDAVLAVNLNAARNVIAPCLAGMKKARSGAIVTIGSGAATRASMTGVQAYCAAKHALLGLTRQLSQELGPWNIRVNCVSPGFVATGESTRRQWNALGDGGQRALVEAVPLRRLGTPDDIARAVLFLLSDLAGFVTGENLAVNGGR